MASGFAPASAGEIPPAEDLLAAGDLGPGELVRGMLMMMSPAGFEHGVITQRGRDPLCRKNLCDRQSVSIVCDGLGRRADRAWRRRLAVPHTP